MSTKELPTRPNLGHLKYQARDLLDAATAGDTNAIQRLIDRHPGFAGLSLSQAAIQPIKLADAQLVIAREYGFTSWPKLKGVVSSNGHHDHTWIIETDLAHNEERAGALLEQHRDSLPYVIAQIKRCHPKFAGATDSEIKKATITVDDARLIYARDHGFEDWPTLAAHVEALSKGTVEEPFSTAFKAVRAGDLDRLRKLLAENPELVSARGTNDNTLLNLAVGNRAPDAARVLIDAGADADLPNNRGWTPLHAAGYANWPELVDPLIRAGARIDRFARGDGGTPLVMALFWGHREAAEALAKHGVVPMNLRVAAGLGRLDLIQAFFEPDGKMKPEAGAHRAFYRVHSGFPFWKPSNNRQEILDEAFVYACKSGRVDVLGYLIEMGADINSDPYRGSGLAWAASKGRIETMRWLLDHGADVNRAVNFGGPGQSGVTSLHFAAYSGQKEAVEFLLQNGADPLRRDDRYNGTPLGWAHFNGQRAIVDVLCQYASIEDAAYTGCIDRVNALLSANPRLVHGSDGSKRSSPLIFAVTGNQPAIVRLLLDHGADPNAKNEADKTALDIAIGQGHEQVAEILRRQGAAQTQGAKS